MINNTESDSSGKPKDQTSIRLPLTTLKELNKAARAVMIGRQEAHTPNDREESSKFPKSSKRGILALSIGMLHLTKIPSR